MDAWPQLIIFPDEDEEALKDAFVLLSAKHKLRFSAIEVAKHVFKGLREPELRSMQAAKVWSEDLEIQERIRQLILYGDENSETNVEKLRKIALSIAESPTESAKDRIAALDYISRTQGDIKKQVELSTPKGEDGRGLPLFQVVQYADD